MNEYVRDSIVEYAWHQFLYGYKGMERTEFLQSMVSRYPVKLYNNEAVAIYLDDYSLPIVENPKKCDEYQVIAIAREYLNVVLVDAIVDQTIRQVELDKLNEKMKTFIDAVNRVLIGPGFEKIKDISEFSKVLKDVKKFYSEEYVKLLQTGTFQGDITSLRFCFIDLNFFANYYKRALNMKNHFSMIVDCKKTGATISQQAINGVVTRRCTGDISMKIACEPEEWKTFGDLNGTLAEYIHDYNVVTLDDSYDTYIKKVKRNRRFED